MTGASEIKRGNSNVYLSGSLKQKLHDEFKKRYKPNGNRALIQDFLSAWRKQLDTPEPSRQALRAILESESRHTCEYRIANGLCQLLLNCSYDEWIDLYQQVQDTTDRELVVTQNCSFATPVVGYSSSQPELKTSAATPQNENSKRQIGVFIPNTRCRSVWGRDDLIEEILQRICDPNEVSILSLTGSPGYGKSEAATFVAKEALKRNLFSDVLWVTARQSELVDGYISFEKPFKSLSWQQFIKEIAYQLACPVEQVHQRLREEKLLLVLDNAETAQIENIVGNLVKMLNPSRALLTSRLRIKPPYLGLIEVPRLEEKWSHILLADEAKYNNLAILRQASDEQLHQLHEFSCGAPLALHFLVGRIFHVRTLEPVLSELSAASRPLETFYRFCLEPTWQRIGVPAQTILRYIAGSDVSVSRADLSRDWKLLEEDLDIAIAELRRWYLIEDLQDLEIDNPRYNLHPWVKSCVRGGLVEKWQPSLRNLKEVVLQNFDIYGNR